MTVLRRMAGVFDAIRLAIALTVLGAISLAVNGAALLALPWRAAETSAGACRCAIRIGYAVFWRIATALGVVRIRFDTLDDLRAAGPIIVAANHPAMFDAALLLSRVPGVCLMKAGLLRNPFVGAAASVAGYIGNVPAHTMIRRAVRALERGVPVVVFPEGTRTSTPPVNRFKAGIGLIAARSGAPVQTVVVHTSSPYLAKGWPMWRVPALPLVVTIRVGRRFDAPQPEAAAEFVHELEAWFRAELGAPADRDIAAGRSDAAGSRRRSA